MYNFQEAFIFLCNYQKLNNQKTDSAKKLSEIANKRLVNTNFAYWILFKQITFAYLSIHLCQITKKKRINCIA